MILINGLTQEKILSILKNKQVRKSDGYFQSVFIEKTLLKQASYIGLV
jgi:hypothetical protein